MSAAAPLRVGIVGLSAAGGWASRAHVAALDASPHFTLTGVAGSTPESTAAAAEKYGLPVAAADPAALAADERVDAIVVAVRVPRHEEILRQVLPFGKPTFSEWPLAPDARVAAELAGLAEQHGAPTAVGLQARHVPQVRLIKRLLEGGYIGEVLSTRLIGDAGGWGAATQSATAYTVDAASGAGMAAIPFGHTLDAVIDVLGPLRPAGVVTAVGQPVVRVLDTGETVRKTTPDQLGLVATTADGAVLTAHYQGGLGPGTTFLWEIRGTAGALQLTGATGHLQFGAVTLRGAKGDGDLEELEPVAGTDYRGVGSGLNGPAAVVAEQYEAWYEALTGTPSEYGTAVDFRHAVAHHDLIDGLLTPGRVARSAERDERRPHVIT